MEVAVKLIIFSQVCVCHLKHVLLVEKEVLTACDWLYFAAVRVVHHPQAVFLRDSLTY